MSVATCMQQEHTTLSWQNILLLFKSAEALLLLVTVSELLCFSRQTAQHKWPSNLSTTLQLITYTIMGQSLKLYKLLSFHL